MGDTRREVLGGDVAERGASAPDRKAQGGGSGGRAGAMAAKGAGGGRWEVVKKGRRPGAGGSGRSGGGDRRALGEANGVWKYDLTREYPPGRPPAPPPAPGLPLRRGSGQPPEPRALLPPGYRALPLEPHRRWTALGGGLPSPSRGVN